MMRLFIVMILFFSVSVFAETTVGNGGDLSEINLTDAWSKLPSYYKLILTKYSQSFTEEEKGYISKLQKSQPSEKNQLVFKSDINNLNFFKGKAYKTGAEVGDQVFINQDLLFIEDEGLERSLTTRESFSLLLFIVSKHHPKFSEFHQLRKKIGIIFSNNTHSISLGSHRRPDIRLEVIKLKNFQFFLTSEKSRINFTQKLRKELSCPLGLKEGALLKVSHLENTFIGNLRADKVDIEFGGELDYRCDKLTFRANFLLLGKYKLEGADSYLWSWYYQKEVTAGLSQDNLFVTVYDIRLVTEE